MQLVRVLIILTELDHTCVHYGDDFSLPQAAQDVQDEGTDA